MRTRLVDGDLKCPECRRLLGLTDFWRCPRCLLQLCTDTCYFLHAEKHTEPVLQREGGT
jgi:predicted amidophosphoribosyltransferase